MHKLIQSEIQSDLISKKVCHFRHMRAEVFRFRSVKYTPHVKVASICNIRMRSVHFQWAPIISNI